MNKNLQIVLIAIGMGLAWGLTIWLGVYLTPFREYAFLCGLLGIIVSLVGYAYLTSTEQDEEGSPMGCLLTLPITFGMCQAF